MRKALSVIFPWDLLAIASATMVGMLLAALSEQARVRRTDPARLRQVGTAAIATGRGPASSGEPPVSDLVAAHLGRMRGDARAQSRWVVLTRIVKRVAQQFLAHRIMTEAAGVTFYALLAIFPALAAMVSLVGLFADPAVVTQHLDAINGFVPGGGLDIITDQIKRLAANGTRALGFGVVVGLATSLWSANAAMKAMFDSLNIVYDESERRSYVRLTLLSLGLTFGAILFILLALAAVVALPVSLNFIGLGNETDLMLRLGRWPALMVVIVLFLAVVYWMGPSREHAKWRWISAGSVFAAIGWVAVSAGFSWYVTNFGSYNRTYGSLGAAIGFMTWIWLSAMVVLIGAEVNADLEHVTEGR
jgi:membrane protein